MWFNAEGCTEQGLGSNVAWIWGQESQLRGQRNAASVAVCYGKHTRTHTLNGQIAVQTHETAGEIKITHYMEYIN